MLVFCVAIHLLLPIGRVSLALENEAGGTLRIATPFPTLQYRTSFCFVLFCFALLCFALLCFALLCFALLCFALLCFALLCFALLCFALLCFALLCFALLCFALLCFALLCFVLFCFVVVIIGLSPNGIYSFILRRVITSGNTGTFCQ